MQQHLANILSTTLGMEGATGMSGTHRVEIDFDDHCYEALLGEAERLHVGVEQIIAKAAAAWITDLAENTACSTPSVSVLAS
jgi:hypothetical protein